MNDFIAEIILIFMSFLLISVSTKVNKLATTKDVTNAEGKMRGYTDREILKAKLECKNEN